MNNIAIVYKAMELIFYGAMTMFAIAATMFIVLFLSRRG